MYTSIDTVTSFLPFDSLISLCGEGGWRNNNRHTLCISLGLWVALRSLMSSKPKQYTYSTLVISLKSNFCIKGTSVLRHEKIPAYNITPMEIDPLIFFVSWMLRIRLTWINTANRWRLTWSNTFSPLLQTSKSNASRVVLTGLDFRSSGLYRCEISIEDSFNTLNRFGRMMVVGECWGGDWWRNKSCGVNEGGEGRAVVRGMIYMDNANGGRLMCFTAMDFLYQLESLLKFFVYCLQCEYCL